MPLQFSYKLTDTNIYGHLMYRIHTNDAKKLDGADLLRVIQDAVLQQNKYLNHTKCNILIFADTFGVIPEQGVGGRCGEPDLINIFIDPNHQAGVRHNVEHWLPSALAHELYHARRYATHPFGKTLGEALVEEGLPSMFEEFIEPHLEVPYAHHLNKEALAKAWVKAKPLINSTEYNRDDWFYGGSGITKWTGYSLGYDVVQQYMRKHLENNPAVFIDASAKDFLNQYNPAKSL